MISVGTKSEDNAFRELETVFVGDTLFAGSIGRTDLPGSSYEMIVLSIKHKLMKLPDHRRVYPGHGEPSTIGKEGKNSFLQGIS